MVGVMWERAVTTQRPMGLDPGGVPYCERSQTAMVGDPSQVHQGICQLWLSLALQKRAVFTPGLLINPPASSFFFFFLAPLGSLGLLSRRSTVKSVLRLAVIFTTALPSRRHHVCPK